MRRLAGATPVGAATALALLWLAPTQAQDQTVRLRFGAGTVVTLLFINLLLTLATEKDASEERNVTTFALVS